MAGKLLVRGRLDAARPHGRVAQEDQPLPAQTTGRRVRLRRGVSWGIAAAVTVGLVAASTVLPRGGSFLPVALAVVGFGWAVIGLVHGVVVVAARVVRRRPPRVEGDAMKAAVYLEDANHAQFNTAWRNSDLPGLAGRMLDTTQVMPGQDQQRDVAVAVLAFLDATVHGDRVRLGVLHDPSHPVWSGATRVLTRYAASGDVVLADFVEDADPATGTLPGTVLLGSGLTVWREEPTPVRGGTLDAASVVLGWDSADPASYAITLPAELRLPADPVLLLDVAEARPGTGADFTVRTRDTAGAVRTTTVAAYGGVPPAPQPRRLRPPLREPLPLVEPFGQTLRIPLHHNRPLAEIQFLFDRAPRGSIRIDRIAISSDATGGQR
jgi:hypothetical protein